MSTTVILGAGFSNNSGIPIQSQIPELLISNQYEESFDKAVSSIIKGFIEDVFGYVNGQATPTLDDIMTCIDISTNSGHHLGIRYSPIHLRFIRRLLVYRIFSIFNIYFKPSNDVKKLLEFLSGKKQDVNYVVLNWDTVLENYITSLRHDVRINYCNGCRPLEYISDAEKCSEIKVLKVHGSSNWLYCDNCRALFNDIDDKISPGKRAGFQKVDFDMFDELKKFDNMYNLLDSPKCRICSNDISSHIATFSYRKSFRANSFAEIWRETEEILTKSDRWVFIGYSLPQADYEFKHLLKIAELKLNHVRKNKLSIDVVLLGGENAIKEYRGFFGDKLNIVCNRGISEYLEKVQS
jgi:hypothetical protein